MAYAEVIIDIRHANVDRIFEYRIPACAGIVPGSRVLVPFGAGNRLTEGYVIGVAETASVEESRIKDVISALDGVVSLRQDQIELAKWMKERYCCPLCSALRLMIPAELKNSRVGEKMIMLAKAVPASQEVIDAAFARAPVQRKIYDTLIQCGGMSLVDLEDMFPGAASAVTALKKKGLAKTERARVIRRVKAAMDASGGADITLTSEQEYSCDGICKSLTDGGGAFLLHGVTGSGKTEVYMAAIEKCLALGKSAIVLVPEISLTPQTVMRFSKRFGEDIAVLHSRLSAGERYDEWRAILDGKRRLVVGARSAVFAPVERLGLIVVDEEHEQSYKSEQTPRYDTIEVARKRAEMNGATLVLGSATPSVETYYEAKKGAYTLLTMGERVNDLPMPEVEIVDMRKEIVRGNRSIFSGALYNAIKKTLADGGQMMFFINRRGHSTFVLCRGCGYVFKCNRCDVTLTYHQVSNTLKCHYCGLERETPVLCPKCGKPYIKRFGVATQKVEYELKKQFPQISVLRMDFDTTRAKDSYAAILNDFMHKKAQALVGTQMIAKGHDFPGVSLVGVIAADASLYHSDYRSFERTFQLITQVAGRAGRSREGGRVIVQTFSPAHPAVVFAAAHDYASFYDYEIKRREASALPPFSVFVRVLFTAKDEKRVRAACAEYYANAKAGLAERLDARYSDVVLSLAWSGAHISRINDESRFQTLLKLRKGEAAESVLPWLQELADAVKLPGGHVFVEINPVSMY